MKNSFLCVGFASVLLSSTAFAQEVSKFYIGTSYGAVKVPKDDEISFSNADSAAIQFGYKITENFSIEAQHSRSIKNARAKYTESEIDISEAWWYQTQLVNPGTTIADMQQFFPYAIADVTIDINARIQTTALYGVYRSSGDLYFKIKAGYLSEKTKFTLATESADVYVAISGNSPIQFNATPKDASFNNLGLNQTDSTTDNNSDFSAGLGAGYKFTQHLFSELEFTKMNDDLDFYSLSINYAF